MKTDEEIGRNVREILALQAARNRAKGKALRAEVRAVWLRHPDYTGKQVIRLLPDRTLPSVRRVQEILKELRLERMKS
jgi:hypothetical protein